LSKALYHASPDHSYKTIVYLLLNPKVKVMNWIVSPPKRDVEVLSIPVSVTLFGNKIFADDQFKERSLLQNKWKIGTQRHGGFSCEC
jgi:exosome complex RNA-binding protein Rrp42 (RNase PH superfamily)